MLLVEKKIHIEYFDPEQPISVPYYEHGLNASFSGLYSDVVLEHIDLMQLLIPRPSSTFLARIEGESLRGDGILPGDRMLIDKSLPYLCGKKIAYYLRDYEGWTVKELGKRVDGYYLLPANDEFKPYKIKEYDLPWGMVTWTFRNEYNRSCTTR